MMKAAPFFLDRYRPIASNSKTAYFDAAPAVMYRRTYLAVMFKPLMSTADPLPLVVEY